MTRANAFKFIYLQKKHSLNPLKRALSTCKSINFFVAYVPEYSKIKYHWILFVYSFFFNAIIHHRRRCASEIVIVIVIHNKKIYPTHPWCLLSTYSINNREEMLCYFVFRNIYKTPKILYRCWIGTILKSILKFYSYEKKTYCSVPENKKKYLIKFR